MNKFRDEQIFEAFTLTKLKEKHSVEVNVLKDELKMKTDLVEELSRQLEEQHAVTGRNMTSEFRRLSEIIAEK